MLQLVMNKRLLFASLLVVLLAFSLAACDAGTGNTTGEPGVDEPLGDTGVITGTEDNLGDTGVMTGTEDTMGDTGVTTDTEDTLGDTGVVTGTEDTMGDSGVTTDTEDTMGDTGVLTGTEDITGTDDSGALSGLDDQVPEELTDDSLGLATAGIVWYDDQFELTGNVEAIENDYIRVTYPENGEDVTQDIYLFSAPHGTRTWADHDLSEGDVVSLAGFVGQSGRYYATEAVLDVGLFEESRPASDDSQDGTSVNGDDDDSDNDDATSDDSDMDDDEDSDLFGDDQEPGIQWNGDEFTLKGYIVGQPDLINNELTIEANGQEYTVYIADTVMYEDNLVAEDLMDGDLVEIEGVRDDMGDLWAHSIQLDDDMGSSTSDTDS